MPDQVQMSSSDIQKRVASKCNDAAWNLIEQPDAGPTEITHLLTLAATARHHWHEVGKPGNIAHADLLFAWALARAGVSKAAVLLASETVAYFEQNGATWERAFAHAAMAAACSADGNTDGFQKHYSLAEQLGAKLSEPDATYFHAAFKTVPRKVSDARS
ncbi:MAG: hypothetical protein ABJN26_15600 [Stappiaceae bacterium]